MKDLRMYNPEEKQQDKSQARLDYEEGLGFLQKGEMSQAANMFHNALIGFERDNDINGAANATDKLGDICAERRDFDNAMQHYDRVIAICQEQGDSISIFALDKKKAKLHADCGRYEQAINLYLDIMAQYQLMRNPKGTVDTLETMAALYLNAGNREKAADCYRTAASIHANYQHKRHAEVLNQKADEVLAQAS